MVKNAGVSDAKQADPYRQYMHTSKWSMFDFMLVIILTD